MRPIIGSQFVYQVLDMKVDGSFRNCQLIRDLLIAIAVSNKPEHFQLPGRKIVVPQMLGEPGRHLRWYVPLAPWK